MYRPKDLKRLRQLKRKTSNAFLLTEIEIDTTNRSSVWSFPFVQDFKWRRISL